MSLIGQRRPEPARGRSLRRSRRGPSSRVELAALLGLLVYFLPLGAAMGHPRLGGGADRAPSIVVARHRQAPVDAATDGRPCPGPSLTAVSPPGVPTAVVHGGAGVVPAPRAPADRPLRASSPGATRAPPIL